MSQATVFRVISACTPLIAACLNGSAPTVEDLDATAQLIIDGALPQCWSWKDHCELCSGKHKTTGLSVQVACALSGTLAWVSDPQDGCAHDAQALRRGGLLDVPAADLPDGASPPRRIGDKGRIGLGMITPRREPAKLPPPAQTTRPTTGPSTRSATRSSESSPTSRPGESCTPAAEDHRKPSRKPSPQSSDSYSPTPYE